MKKSPESIRAYAKKLMEQADKLEVDKATEIGKIFLSLHKKNPDLNEATWKNFKEALTKKHLI